MIKTFCLCIGLSSVVEGMKHHRSSHRQNNYFLMGSSKKDFDETSSVMICTGNFAARRSVCSSITDATKDVIPSELFLCSKAMTTGAASDVFSGSSETVKLNFASPGALKLSLDSMLTPNKVLVSYGDCNSVSNLPDLETGRVYFSILVLDNMHSKDSVTLNSLSTPGSARVDIQNPVDILDIDLFSDPSLAAQIAGDFMHCQNNPRSPCSPSTMYNPQVVRVPNALLELDRWWSL